MQAQVISQFGGVTIFETAQLPVPQVLHNHVLIQVLATSVNPVDYKIRAGIVADIAPDFPAVLHGDVAGMVEAIGEGVTAFQPEMKFMLVQAVSKDWGVH